MPEIKHVFNQGKMNKDLDERLVPNGQYIDANNIQVTTSEGSDAGTVRSLLGNSALTGTPAGASSPSITTITTAGVCVGSISDEKNNAAYWFIASSPDYNTEVPTEVISYKSAIYKTEYNDNNTHNITPVFIDFYLEKQPDPFGANAFDDDHVDLSAGRVANLSEDMYIKLVYNSSLSVQWRKITGITGNTITFDSKITFASSSNPEWVEFSWGVPNSSGYQIASNFPPNGVLEFDKNNIITGVNIIDDLLFWTDNSNEPKKINITRSIAGTDPADLNKNTRIVIPERGISRADDAFVKKQDITVIKKSPKEAPLLDLITSGRSGNISTTANFNFDGVNIGESVQLDISTSANYKPNDVVLLGNNIIISQTNNHVRARVKNKEDLSLELIVLSKSSNIPTGGNYTWNLYLEETSEKIFEEKLVRFAVRWKYVDGEYSSISPFSQTAFIPSDFNYDTATGFNTGMVNQIKEVVIRDFIPNDIPNEVVEVEILYKESDSPIIYSVDNIKNNDISIGGNNSWNKSTPNNKSQGKYSLTSKSIYSKIPSNQILRPFDAVPKAALAQSVVGNRLVYANYLQNFNITSVTGDYIKPILSSFINFRTSSSTELLENEFALPTNTTNSTDVSGWFFDSTNGWKGVNFGLLPGQGLGGGFENKEITGVTENKKVWQNVTFKDEETYIVKIKVEGVTSGTIKILFVSPNFYTTKYIDKDGDYEFNITIDKEASSGGQLPGLVSFIASGKTFVIQSSSPTNPFIGKISDFSIKQVEETNKKSIKSQRNYQIGVVYADEYGRQTPVLTNETASLKVGKKDSENENSIGVKLLNNTPIGASCFKFFIKETSTPYHNMAVNRVYESNDGNAWLSFPSPERNKIDEEDYLVLKKQLDSTVPVVDESATYKILAIKNEAPEDIKKTKTVLGIGTGGGKTNGINLLFSNATYRPIDDTKILYIQKDVWINDDLGTPLDQEGDVKSGFQNNLSISFFNSGTNRSKYYKITSISETENNANDYYVFHLASPISDFDAAWIMDGVEVETSVSITIVRDDIEEKQEFDGKFFVKVYLDANLIDFVQLQSKLTESTMAIVSRASCFHVSDDAAVGVGDGTATAKQIASTDFRVFYNTDTPPLDSNGNNKYPFTTASAPFYDESGDSGYSPIRGVAINADNNNQRAGEENELYKLAMSEASETKWNRILKFDIPGFSSDQDLNVETGSNFFIDRVRYIGTQPLSENNPGKGIYQPPGYWNHTHSVVNNGGAKVSGSYIDSNKFGRGIFRADSANMPKRWISANGNSSSVTAVEDNFFTAGKYYMEISYAKIHASSDLLDIPLSNIDNEESYANAWSVGSNSNTNHSEEASFVKKIKPGSKFRFSEDINETAYKITKIKQEKRYNHTPYPGGPNGDFIICVLAEGTKGTTSTDSNPDRTRWIKPSNIQSMRTNVHLGTRIQAGTQELRKFTANTTDAGLSEWVDINATSTIDNEKIRFGQATNRRLTWIIEFELFNKTIDDGGPGVDGHSGVSYHNPLDVMGNNTSKFVEFVEASIDETEQLISDNPAVFETKPKRDEDLEVYYEASDFIDIKKHSLYHELPWFNCYSFGNGVESNRIKDDFNQVFLDKNAVVSTTFQSEYKEERRKYGLIYSGIYNSTTSTNELNQFIIAEKITKDINPEYGSIQKLYARNSDLVALCEDKVLRILSNKDAVFNADGNTNLTATENVLGQTIPFAGNYGISSNPESFAVDSYRIYFADKQRGAVLRLSMDGLTPISNYGMKDYFKDNLKSRTSIIGSYDASKDEYNITLIGTDGVAPNNVEQTVSYSEEVKGWSSKKSFIPQQALSVANNYYSFALQNNTVNSKVWWHHQNAVTNNFYGQQFYSDVTLILNQSPGVIKTYKTINYEGSQGKVDASDSSSPDGEYYNLAAKTGWHASAISTDKQSGTVDEFIEKEGKWYNYVKGNITTLANLDTGEFTVQGLGIITAHTFADE